MDTESQPPPDATPVLSTRTLGELREFFGRSEAPWRVTIVIIATFIGVLIVAWDTARRTKPSSSSAVSAPAHPAPPQSPPKP